MRVSQILAVMKHVNLSSKFYGTNRLDIWMSFEENMNLWKLFMFSS